MKPRLAVMAGPLEGTLIPLELPEVSIGRDKSNPICINDVSVSRRHSVISRTGDQFNIKDLGSHNGTRVNGTPVGERTLEHGDMIAMGDSLLLFLLNDEEETKGMTEQVEIGEQKWDLQSTTLLRIEDAIYLYPDKVLAALPPTARMARMTGAAPTHRSRAEKSPAPHASASRIRRRRIRLPPAQEAREGIRARWVLRADSVSIWK